MQLLHEIYAIWEIFRLYAISELCHWRRNRTLAKKTIIIQQRSVVLLF